MSTQVIPQNRTVYYEGRIEIIECCSCSVDFGLGSTFIANRRKDKGTFYCPNGHPQGYFGPNADEKRAKRLEEERDAARALAQREAQRRSQAESEARTADYQRRAAKGQLTKTKKRVAAGVCPCCTRSFQNLGRHMAGQHPDYVEGGDV